MKRRERELQVVVRRDDVIFHLHVGYIIFARGGEGDGDDEGVMEGLVVGDNAVEE